MDNLTDNKDMQPEADYVGQFNSLCSYFPEMTEIQLSQMSALYELYSDWNSKINVISRKDIGNLYLHHVLHSLGISKMLRFKPGSQIMDLGTGGGFPGIPLAILFPEVHFHLEKNIRKEQRNALPNGLICLKGGELQNEIHQFRKKADVIDLKDYFKETYFETKRVIYIPL